MEEEREITLHADGPLTKEQAAAIERAVAAIGPIRLAGMGLKATMDKTAKLIEAGIERMEQAERVFDQRLIHDPAKCEEEMAEMKQRLDQLTKERDEWKAANEYHQKEVEKGNQFREKLKSTIVQLHDRLTGKNKKINQMTEKIDELEMELDRAVRVIDYMTKKKEC